MILNLSNILKIISKNKNDCGEKKFREIHPYIETKEMKKIVFILLEWGNTDTINNNLNETFKELKQLTFEKSNELSFSL
jgi:hypothetical protein